jgi:predicted Zn-dependent protease
MTANAELKIAHSGDRHDCMPMNSAKRTAWASVLLLIASIGVQYAAARGQEKPIDAQNSNSASDAQGATPSTKAKIHRGGIDDIDAIGKRKLGGMDWYSEAKEARMGRQLARELEQNQTLLSDLEVTEYVNRTGQNLVANSDAKGPIVIKVLQSNEVNCQTLPGGFLYLTTGLIMAAGNEAELAGVIAQGIAHIAARHATRAATRMSLEAIREAPYTHLTDNGSASYPSKRLSREFTKEADYLAVQYMYKAGYDPDAFVTFLRKLQDREELRSPNDHAPNPPTADRIQNALKEIARILPTRAHSILNTPEFERIQSRLRALPAAL